MYIFGNIFWKWFQLFLSFNFLIVSHNEIISSIALKDFEKLYDILIH